MAKKVKMKTRSSAKRRFKKVGNGKGGSIKRGCAYRSHLLTKKSSKRKRNLRKGSMIHSADLRAVREMLPY